MKLLSQGVMKFKLVMIWGAVSTDAAPSSQQTDDIIAPHAPTASLHALYQHLAKFSLIAVRTH